MICNPYVYNVIGYCICHTLIEILESRQMQSWRSGRREFSDLTTADSKMTNAKTVVSRKLYNESARL